MAKRVRHFEVVPLAGVVGKAESEGEATIPGNSEKNKAVDRLRSADDNPRQKPTGESLLDKTWVRGGTR